MPVCNSILETQGYKVDPLANIFLNGRYVTFDEWKKSQRIKKSDIAYPAYVPSIHSSDVESYGRILKECGYILGSNLKPTDETCGKIYRKVVCSENELHDHSYRHIRCNDAGCPICYTKAASKMADRVAERLQGYRVVYRGEPISHLIFWPQRRDGRPYAGLLAAFREAKRLLKIMGARMAVVWYHPYRIREDLKNHLRRYMRTHGLVGKIGFWKLAHDDVLGIGGLENYIVSAPHFHAVTSGYLMHVKKFSKVTGGAGYKKKRYLRTEEQIHTVAHYISTHACREAEKSSVRYFGEISYRMLSRELVEKKVKTVRCVVCSAKMHEYETDENGVVSNRLKENITKLEKKYLYWITGTQKPSVSEYAQYTISCFSS